MRSYDELEASARDGSPFSNGTSGEIWMDRWCYRCKVDAAFQRDEANEGCPLLLLAYTGRTPAEWIELSDLPQDYTCTEFIPDDEEGGGSEPEPPPEPVAEMDGQVDIFAVFADQITETATHPLEAAR